MRTAAVFGGAWFASPPDDVHSNPCKALCLAKNLGETACSTIPSNSCHIRDDECGPLYWTDDSKEYVFVFQGHPPRPFVKVSCREAFSELRTLAHPAVSEPATRIKKKKTARINEGGNEEVVFKTRSEWNREPVDGGVDFDRALGLFKKLDEYDDSQAVEDPGHSCPTARIEAQGITGSVAFVHPTMEDRAAMISTNGDFLLSRSDLSLVSSVNKHVSELFDLPGIIRSYRITSMSPDCAAAFALYDFVPLPLKDAAHNKALSDELVFAIAQRVMETVKQVHSLGIVHTDLFNSFMWDGARPESIKLGSFGFSRIFVLPGTRYHFPPGACRMRNGLILTRRDSDGTSSCVSRAVDFQDLARLFSALLGNRRTKSAADLVMNAFAEYASSLWLTHTPAYDKWLTLFAFDYNQFHADGGHV